MLSGVTFRSKLMAAEPSANSKVPLEGLMSLKPIDGSLGTI